MIGVIGGMGPYAGIDLVKNIFDMTKASSDQEHVPLSMISLPHLIEDRTAFLLGKSQNNPGIILSEIAMKLIEQGATAIGMPCKIVIEETHEQRTWENADGSLGEQEPKINPQTSEVLTKGGLPIYRNSRLTLNMEEADVFIMHDKVSATTTAKTAATQALNS